MRNDLQNEKKSSSEGITRWSENLCRLVMLDGMVGLCLGLTRAPL